MSWVWAGRKLKGMYQTYGIMLGNKNWGGEGGRERCPEQSCLPKKPLCIMRIVFLKVAAHLPTDGNWQINSLVCFACIHSFCFSCNYLFLSSWVLTLLSFQFPPLSNLGTVSREFVVLSCCWVQPQQHRRSYSSSAFLPFNTKHFYSNGKMWLYLLMSLQNDLY